MTSRELGLDFFVVYPTAGDALPAHPVRRDPASGEGLARARRPPQPRAGLHHRQWRGHRRFRGLQDHQKEDWVDLYAKPYYFGCEADDRMNATAFGRN